MSLNSTPASERVHIGIFGKRNAGKSSVINAITGQELAIVSEIKGTTTDPVYKSMELLPLGPVVVIDTPGLDDEGELGEKRIEKSLQVLDKTDIAVLVVDGVSGISRDDELLQEKFKEKGMPYVVVINKLDLMEERKDHLWNDGSSNIIYVSTRTGKNIHELKELLAKHAPLRDTERKLVSDLISPMDFVVLVVPIDKAAPKGRLILPQQQTIRDILEGGGVSVVVKESELEGVLRSLGKKPELVITDSQVFDKVSKITPQDIKLTSFSILFARYKGILEDAVRGARALDTILDGDTLLISEGCTHHRQCEDIGTVKLPRLIRKYTGKNINFEFTSGREFPSKLEKYKAVVHCGGCMLNDREMISRIGYARTWQVPVTNYGILMAHIQGILERCIAPFETNCVRNID